RFRKGSPSRESTPSRFRTANASGAVSRRSGGHPKAEGDEAGRSVKRRAQSCGGQSLLGSGASGWQAAPVPPGGVGEGPLRPRNRLDAYEAVFRSRLQNHPRDVRAYLSVDGRDLPADLLRRLPRDWPNLAPASEEPKEKGLRFYVSDLKWIDAN